MLNPMCDKIYEARTGGEKGRHLRPRLVQKIAEDITSNDRPLLVQSETRIEKKIKKRAKSAQKHH